MSRFVLNNTVDKNKVFLTQFSEIEGRFDAFYFQEEFKSILKKIDDSPFEKLNFKSIIKSITNGYDYRDYKSTGIPYIKVANVKKGYFDFSKIQYIDFGSDELNKNIQLKKGNILLTRKGTFGNAFSLDNDYNYIISSEIFYIELNKLLVNSKYLEIYFNSNIGQKLFLRESIGAIMGSLSQESLKSIKIPLPPKETQQQMVDLYQNAYQQKQQKENQAKELLASIDTYLLNELGITLPQKDNSLQKRMFTTQFSEISGSRFDCDYYSEYYESLEEAIENSNFPTNSISSIIINMGSGKTPASSDYSDEKTENPIIKVGSYTGDYIDLDKLDYTFKKNNLIAEKEDIFILSAAHQAEYVGKHIKYLNEKPLIPTSFVGELICVRANKEKCNSMYLFSLLNNEIYKTLINREKTGQTSHVYAKDIKYIKIPLPPLFKQNEIAEYIQNIRTQVKQLQTEAVEVLEQAKQQVEKMILGE